MPISSQIETIYAERAKQLAERTETHGTPEIRTPVAVVAIGSEQYGIPTHYLSCVVKTPPVAQMPRLPVWLRGIAQIRGELVGVVSLARWFSIPGKNSDQFLAVVEHKGKKLGILLDAVNGFRDVGQSELAEIFTAGATGDHPVMATTKDILSILDIPKMFENRALQVGIDSGERAPRTDPGVPHTSGPGREQEGDRP